jgi:hypothetical protein
LLGRALGLLGRIRQRKGHKAFVDARHALNDRLRESAANRTNSDDSRRLDVLDSGDEIPRRRVLMCLPLLKIDEIYTV